MSAENRILVGGLVTAALLPLVVGGVLGWPAWVTVPVFLVVVVGVFQKLQRRHDAVDHVGALLDKIGLHNGNPVRVLTAHRLAKLVEVAGKRDVAEDIRREFDRAA